MGYKFNPFIFTGLDKTGSPAAAGANTDLSNLTSPTAINQDLLPGLDDTYDVGSSSLQFAEGHFTPASLAIGTGLTPTFWAADIPGLIIDGTTPDAISAFGAGIIYKGDDGTSNFLIATQDRSDGLNTATIYMSTGYSTGNVGTGDFSRETGGTSAVGEDTGNILDQTGSNPLGTTGFIRQRTGGGANTGSIELVTGNASAGPSGGIFMTTGTASGGTRGSFIVDALEATFNNNVVIRNQKELHFREGTGGGTNAAKIRAPATLAADYTLTLPVDDGTPSQVLTTDGSGVLSWTTPAAAGANTTLSNLTATVAVNQNLQPDTNGIRNLGALSFNWSSLYLRSMFLRNSTADGTSIQLQSSGQTSPSGAKTTPTINNSIAGEALTLYTASSSGAVSSGAYEIETGNTVDGNSGNIILRTGVPSGTGTKGNVNLQSKKVRRSADNTNFIEEEYIHSITLAASQTNAVISSLTYAHASFEGIEIVYKTKEATTNNVRSGVIRIANNGTLVSSSDEYNETGDIGITITTQVNGANIEVLYTSGANICTMRADVKRIST